MTMGCHQTILVIEDEEAIRRLLVMALELEGHVAVSAENGKAGLELLRTIEGPCLILLDLMMPVMNGWEFLQTLRRENLLAVIPVVIVSAVGADLEGHEILHEIQGCLKKPIDYPALLSFVNKYCSQDSSQVATRAS